MDHFDFKKKLTVAGAAAALFFVLAPGHIVSLPPVDNADGTKGTVIRSGKVDMRSAAAHAVLFGAGFYGILYAMHWMKHSKSGSVDAVASSMRYRSGGNYAMSTYANLPASQSIW